jgi:hypothetical protein
MAEDLHEKAKELATKLGALTDDLNEQLTQAEKVLKDFRLGVRASIQLRIDDDGRHDYLVFGKYDSAWHLIYESDYEGKEDSLRSSLLVNASREVRLLAAGNLEVLLAAMLDVAEESIEDGAAAVDQVRNFIATWGKPGV